MTHLHVHSDDLDFIKSRVISKRGDLNTEVTVDELNREWCRWFLEYQFAEIEKPPVDKDRNFDAGEELLSLLFD